ncbi:primosomal protein N' [Vallitalea pronyensis]|uniref:Replication restart protein PriA n=1 Tax=Vallitalea pronyensis TaxID=1348613 RepID=A0A8J8MJP1_9FIRM|nr:primosomal protein N' [Vallitalea pronyensis]QUI22920.1 primosomal protein N' [Vallitalea pronyensis]
MKIYVDIIVDISHSSLDRIFQYRIPKSLMDEIQVGMVVNIPFGKGNKQIKGYVIGLSDTTDYDVTKIKEVISIASDSVSIESHLISLAAWMKERYGCTVRSALKVLLPVNRKVHEKVNKEIIRLVDEETLQKAIDAWKQKKYHGLYRAGEYLMHHKKVMQDQMTKDIKVTTAVLKNLEKKGIVQIKEQGIYRNPYGIGIKPTDKIKANKEQQRIINEINNHLGEENKIFLIHGITGSGKTEVYMQIIDKVISEGKQAIVLIPEIALTPQTVKRFIARFGHRVGVMHSKLSQGERYDQWRRATEGDIDIMIGPRSAVFTPFSRLGIVIIDEEHEMTYKSETSPKYHAREVAIQRGEMTGATVVLGSATPCLESYHMAQKGHYTLVTLKEKAATSHSLQVDVVDMREELANGNKSIFSQALKIAIMDKLERNEQIILFLNRRGYARFVSCRQCGYVVKCDHCDIPYTYHATGAQLICHYCGKTINMVKKCPACESKYIKQFGIGTQQVEDLTKREFPQANILRMDLDTTTKKNSYDTILGSFRDGKADILIGTQMIAKGHDFPKVTLVGVIAADLSLYMSDFRASERTFQLLTQVTGRAGRSILQGRAIIQSYTPDHYSITCAKEQDYEGFYEAEIMYRQLMGYPPFSNLLVLLLQSKHEKELITRSFELARDIGLVAPGLGIEVIGPSPANLSKINHTYRRVILLKTKDYKTLTLFFNKYMHRLHVKYNDITIQWDMNPLISY